jgi:GMP synthase (glutamine-hydrolysing)
MNSIAILDFGSQYAQIIARRVREAQVYCELFPWDAPQEKILSIQPKGFILSGGPKSVYEENAPFIQKFILESGLPILGICYGMQALTHALGGKVDPSAQREYGHAEIEIIAGRGEVSSPEGRETLPLLSGISKVWMSHGDKVTQLPEGFVALAKSGNSPYAAMGDLKRNYFGVQFHPEVHHTPNGIELFKHFATDICGITPDWTPDNIIEESVKRIREQVGDQRVLAAVSGGVDSSVAAALVHKAIGDQLVCVFVDTGLLRADEGAQVASAFRGGLGAELVTVNAADDFLGALKGVTDPEQKRKSSVKNSSAFLSARRRTSVNRNFWCREPSTLTLWSPLDLIAARRRRSSRITTWADCPKTWNLNSSNRCAICSRMKSAWWAKPWD